MATSIRLFVYAATLGWMTAHCVVIAMENQSNTTEPGSTPELGDFPQDDSGTSLADRVRNIVVATVIGVGCVATLCLFVVCALLHCYFTRDKVRDLDGMEWAYQDEYEARINFDVLDKLDPSLRENIDLDFLAHLTNTDPVLLDKYRVQTQVSREGDTSTNSLGSSHMLHPLSPSQSSMNSVHVVPALRRSSTVKLQSVVSTSTPQSPVIKRVSTFTDIKDLLNMSLNVSQTGLSRHTSLMRQTCDHAPYRGSHPNMEEGQKAEGMTQQLLRLLTVVKMAEQNNEQETSNKEISK